MPTEQRLVHSRLAAMPSLRNESRHLLSINNALSIATRLSAPHERFIKCCRMIMGAAVARSGSCKQMIRGIGHLYGDGLHWRISEW
jgi:hypothetical protein